MIRVVWKDPNYSCRITDQNDVEVEEIHWADSQASLERTLQDRVARGEIKEFDSVGPFDYEKWKTRASNATDDAIKNHGPGYEFRSGVWADLKPFLIFLFGGKCAYCEAGFDVVAWGDVEHFRPKAKVVDADGNEVMVGRKPHPGYYWLAYDPANLMPSCQPCNQAWGKMNQFPITANGKRAVKPGDSLADEGALLLCPYDGAIDPAEHLDFSSKKTDPVPGLARAKTNRGEVSIKAYHLNRQQLIRERAKAQDALIGEIAVAIGAQRPLRSIRDEYAAGRRAFSAAVLKRYVCWQQENL